MTEDLLTSRIPNLPDDPDERAAVIADVAEEFLRCGGVLSLADYLLLSEESRDALSLARRRLRWRMAGLIGAAVRSEEVRTAMLTGEDVEDVHVERAMDAALAKLKEEPK